MASTLTWLHLSDLHMRRDELDNLRVVLDVLWGDLPAQINQVGGKLDFIAFTGDIAYSGKAEEYELAEEYFFQPLLDVTGLSPAKLFIVPGNHDVDWGSIKWPNLAIAASLTDRGKVTDLLKSDNMRRAFLEPLDSYAQFIQRYFGQFSDHQILRDPPYYYVQHIASGNLPVALIGLNSAWLSGYTKDTGGNVVDRGNLLIGDKQIGNAIREAEKPMVRIALMHHPPSWLKEFDELDVNRWLRPGCDFVLLGHLHFPNFEEEKALGRETINIPAGTVYQSREWLNGYNLVQLNFDTGCGKIILRRYSEERREWVKDVQSTGDKLDGLVEFDLPGPLSQPSELTTYREGRIVTAPPGPPPPSATSPVTRVLVEIKPSWLRLGRERETQLLETFLQQERRDTLWIWGEDGCGLTEFLQIVRALLKRKSTDVIYFDAEDAAFGIAVDQHYFLDKLERWAGTAPEVSAGWASEDIDERLQRLLAGAEGCLAKSGRRLVLIFANYHLLIPAIRGWVLGTLWGQMLEPLKEYRTLAIFACEGSAPACPASDQENKIHLAEFTVQDIERFLRAQSSVADEKIPELARKIHSGDTDEFLALPRDVFREMRAQAIQLGLVSAQVSSLSSEERRKESLTEASEREDFKVEATAQIFLSYARPDQKEVEDLYQRLSDAGFKPWMDKKDILPGEIWKVSVEKAIRRSDFFMACLSANSVDRRGVLQREIKVALDVMQELLDIDIYLIPVRLKACEVPESLRDLQWVDLFEKGGWTRLVKAIQTGIKRRRGKP